MREQPYDGFAQGKPIVDALNEKQPHDGIAETVTVK